MTTAEYTVTGMTCSSCERHVHEEVSHIGGVVGVEVSRETGKLVVTAEGPIVDTEILAAVDEAGYAAVPA